MKACSLLASCFLVQAVALHADVRTSASYSISGDSLDGGSGSSTSERYTNHGSAGAIADVAAKGKTGLVELVSGSEPGIAGPPATITLAPVAATTVVGQTATFIVAATGDSTPTFQWQRRRVGSLPDESWVDLVEGGAYRGVTSASLTVTTAAAMNGDQFRVVVGNGSGDTVATSPVALSLTYPPRLLNLSTRGLAESGDNVLIPGFVIAGTADKKLLIRAVGPTLSQDPFDLAGVLPDPTMVLKKFNSATGHYEDIASNDDWQTNANAGEITSTSASLGAFGLTDAKDAALLVSLAPGQYSIIAGDRNGTSGLGIVELYDADDSTVDSHLVNISNRGFCGVGNEVMIPGFVVSSEGTKTLLVRVVGPTLGNFGVKGVMANPKLAIYSGSNPILQNDDWGTSSDADNTRQVAQQVGAFPLAEGGKDAASVVTLNPGAYTIVGSSSDGVGTGVVLVEVYEVN